MLRYYPQLRSITLLMVLAVAVTLAPAASVWATTLQEEIELGQKLDAEILKQTPLSADKQAQKEITELGQKLVKAGVKRPEIEYHFQVLQDDDLNAFSTPGGYVYFSERLWNAMRRDERIGVLAHEIVHTDRRHALDAISKAQRRQLWLAVLLTAVNANSTWANIADIAHSMYTLKYSRGDERQADEFGVKLCAKAGFNPAGLLLAMRKINRFQSEQGSQPPKIFSSHPPTKERLQYLEQLLTKMNVPIPPENVGEKPAPHKIGEVTGIGADSIQFNSSKQLKPGDVVWLMKEGWDYHYENRTGRPVARGIVRTQGPVYSADMWPMGGGKDAQAAKGNGVYAPPEPKPETGAGRFAWRSRKPGDTATLTFTDQVKPFDRFLARQTVWNEDQTQLVRDNAGYVVVTGQPVGNHYVAADRPEYSYAPVVADSVLVRLKDPAQARWLGPVVSIGRGGQTLELATSRTREQLSRDQALGKRFDVVRPAWDSKEDYASRVMGKAAIKSLDKKIVLQMVSFEGAWSIQDVENGFDIYEEKPAGDGGK